MPHGADYRGTVSCSPRDRTGRSREAVGQRKFVNTSVERIEGVERDHRIVGILRGRIFGVGNAVVVVVRIVRVRNAVGIGIGSESRISGKRIVCIKYPVAIDIAPLAQVIRKLVRDGDTAVAVSISSARLVDERDCDVAGTGVDTLHLID